MTPAEPCPDLVEIESLALDQLEPAPSARVRAHLTTCITCTRRLEELRADIDLGERLRRALGGVNEARLPEIEGYQVLREVGRGGMGIVYEAWQLEPKRRVALKVVRGAQFVDAQTLQLFKREIRVLARLEHPGIASLYGAGETGGEHWFAMEFVEGKPLTAHARELDVPAKLERFLQLCDAIEHAHRHGVVHRDLKPSNVMVTDQGRVQVLDFGLAKITDADVSLVTEAGHIRGTLAYMSPEQARGDPAEIGLASDVYSLGVLLFELLCDTLPIDTAGVAIHEAARRVALEPPRRPSAIVPGLRGDLETILLKALEKEAHRRYAGAAELAEDVRRFLANEVILARPPSTAYELRKLVARHKVPFALAALVLVGAVGTAIWTSVLYSRESDLLAKQSKLSQDRQTALLAAQEQTTKAEKASAEARQQTTLAERRLEQANHEAEAREEGLRFLVDIFSDIRPSERGANKVTADELLRRGIARLKVSKEKSENARMMILWSVGSAATRAGLLDEAGELLEEALELARRNQPGQPVLGSVLASLGLLREAQGRAAESAELMKESQLVFAAAEGTKSRNSIQARLNYARSMRDAGNPRRAADIARETLLEAESSEEARDKVLDLKVVLGLALYDLRETAEARTVLTAALSEHEHERPSARFASALHTLGLVHYGDDRLDEAREQLQEALDMRLSLLAPDDDAISASYNALGAVANSKGEHSVALDWMFKADAIMSKRYGTESLQVALLDYNRARILLQLDDVDAAEKLMRHSLEVRRKHLGNDSLRVGECLVIMGEIAVRKQDPQAAEPALLDAVRILDLRLGKPHASTLQARFRLVQCYVAAKRADDARTVMEDLQVLTQTSKQLNAAQRQAVVELAKQVEELAAAPVQAHTHSASESFER